MKDLAYFLEEIAANGHVALNMMQYDGWLLRFSGGFTGRANSISVIYPSRKEMAENRLQKTARTTAEAARAAAHAEALTRHH